MTSRILMLCVAFGLCCGAGCTKKTDSDAYATVEDLEGLRKEVEAKPNIEQITAAFNNASAAKATPTLDPEVKKSLEETSAFIKGLKENPTKVLGLPAAPTTSVKDDVAAGVTAAFEARDKKEEEKAAARKDAEEKAAKDKRDQETNDDVKALRKEVQGLKELLTDSSKRVRETNAKEALGERFKMVYQRTFRVYPHQPPTNGYHWFNWDWKGVTFTVWYDPWKCSAFFVQQDGGQPLPDAGKHRDECTEVLKHRLEECEKRLREKESPQPTNNGGDEKKEVVIIRKHGSSRCDNPACDFCHPALILPPGMVPEGRVTSH